MSVEFWHRSTSGIEGNKLPSGAHKTDALGLELRWTGAYGIYGTRISFLTGRRSLAKVLCPVSVMLYFEESRKHEKTRSRGSDKEKIHE